MTDSGLLFVALLFLAFGMMVGGYLLKNAYMVLVDTSLFVLLSIMAWTLTTGTDIYYWIGFLTAFMVLLTIIEAWTVGDHVKKKIAGVRLPEDDDMDEDDPETEEEMKYALERVRRSRATEAQHRQLRTGHPGRVRKQQEQRKLDRFERTGKF